MNEFAVGLIAGLLKASTLTNARSLLPSFAPLSSRNYTTQFVWKTVRNSERPLSRLDVQGVASFLASKLSLFG